MTNNQSYASKVSVQGWHCALRVWLIVTWGSRGKWGGLANQPHGHPTHPEQERPQKTLHFLSPDETLTKKLLNVLRNKTVKRKIHPMNLIIHLTIHHLKR